MNEIIEKMVSIGEFVILNNSYQYSYEKITKILTTQISLSLSVGDSFLGFKMKKKPKILVINVDEQIDNSFFETMIKQLNNKNISEHENIHVTNISPKSLINASDIEDISKAIVESDYDIIFWDNINKIQEFFGSHFKKIDSFEDPLDHTIFIIRQISGMKTKFISHLYSHILDKDGFQKINDIGTSTITFYHKNIIDGYQIEFENKYKNNKSILNLDLVDELDLFFVKTIDVYEKDIKIKEENFDNPKNPLI